MKEIVERLKENRQIAIAKSILESNGYRVSPPDLDIDPEMEMVGRGDEFLLHAVLIVEKFFEDNALPYYVANEYSDDKVIKFIILKNDSDVLARKFEYKMDSDELEEKDLEYLDYHIEEFLDYYREEIEFREEQRHYHREYRY